MPRALKPLKVGDWSGYDGYSGRSYGVKIELFYDRNKHDHFAKFGEAVLRHKDLDQLKRMLRDNIESWLDVTWVPVIHVKAYDRAKATHRDRANRSGRVFLEYERFWHGTLKSGGMRQLRWHWVSDIHLPDDEMPPPGVHEIAQAHNFHWDDHYRKGPFTLPFVHAGGGYSSDLDGDRIVAWLPYSRELWLGLEALGEQIIRVREFIADLVGLPEGHEKLLDVGAKQAIVLPPHTSHLDRSPYLPPPIEAPKGEGAPPVGKTERVTSKVDPGFLDDLLANAGFVAVRQEEE